MRLLGIFHERKERRERELYAERVESLFSKLGLTEPLEVYYMGPSPLFLRFCAAGESTIVLGEKSRVGSIAGLAKRELTNLFVQCPDLYRQYFAGRALGLSPKRVLELHRKYGMGKDVLDNGVLKEIAREGKECPGELSVDAIRKERGKVETLKAFKEQYPEEDAYLCYAVKVETNKSRNAYDIVVPNLAFKEIRIEDPITSAKLEQLARFLADLPGELSGKIMREQMARVS
jgi:hypothetical protein